MMCFESVLEADVPKPWWSCSDPAQMQELKFDSFSGSDFPWTLLLQIDRASLLHWFSMIVVWPSWKIKTLLN